MAEQPFTWSDTWPVQLAKMFWNAAKLPGDVYQGNISMLGADGRTNPEVINRSADLAGMVMGGTYAGAPAGAIGAGAVRRGAALPMDEASRMARAQAMGFRTNMPLAHGSASEFRAFDPSRGAATSGAEPGRMGVFAEVRRGDSPIADEFAETASRASSHGGNPQVYPLLHRTDRPAQLRLTGDETNAEMAATLAQAWDDGLDAVLLRNYTSPGGKKGDILVVKDPSQLRSPFAQFDPSKKNSPDLLASLAGMLGGGAMLGSSMSQDGYR